VAIRAEKGDIVTHHITTPLRRHRWGDFFIQLLILLSQKQ
jgi:hypothetical protein